MNIKEGDKVVVTDLHDLDGKLIFKGEQKVTVDYVFESPSHKKDFMFKQPIEQRFWIFNHGRGDRHN